MSTFMQKRTLVFQVLGELSAENPYQNTAFLSAEEEYKTTEAKDSDSSSNCGKHRPRLCRGDRNRYRPVRYQAEDWNCESHACLLCKSRGYCENLKVQTVLTVIDIFLSEY